MGEDLRQPDTAGGPDWAAYYRHTQGRQPRPLFDVFVQRPKHWTFDIVARRPMEPAR